MKRIALIAAASTLALVASPAFAQARGGPGGGGGGGGGMGHAGGMGGSMGAGPPMSVPGRTMDPMGSARDIASQRGQFGRDFAEQQKMNRAEQAQMMRERVEDYSAKSAERRAEALARRDATKAGANPGLSSKELRAEFKADMEAWREAFRVGRKDWQDQRDQWLVDADSLTPEQWAERRAAWFEARDAWIARQKDWAATNGTGDGDDDDTGG
jgi:hypothetical protein